MMATDSDYALPTLVAISSIFTAIDNPTNVQIYLIVPSTMPQHLGSAFEAVTNHYKANPIRFIESPDNYKDADLHIQHTSAATYYRLNLPELLPDVDTCLYLDGDIIAAENFLDDFSFPMDNALIAGVKAAGYYHPPENQQNQADRLHIDAFDSYVNAGVLMMNLDLMRKENLTAKFAELLQENFPSQDQDILNSACYGRIRVLDPSLNLMTKYHPLDSDSFNSNPCIRLCWTQEEWQSACKKPKIVHYADFAKPWIDSAMDFSDRWWAEVEKVAEICNDSTLFLSLIRKNTDSFLLQRSKLEKANDLFANEREQRIAGNRRINQLTQENQSKEKKLLELGNQISHLEASLHTTQKSLNSTQRTLEKRTSQLDQTKIKLKDTKSELKDTKSKNTKLTKRVDSMLESNSWKIGRAITYAPRATKRAFAKLKKTSHRKDELVPSQSILLYDVSIETDNLGDEIIMQYVQGVIRELFPNHQVYSVPTHRVPKDSELASIPPDALRLVFGTNIICPDVQKYNLWRMPDNLSYCENTVFAAVGMNNYGNTTDASRQLYQSIANKTLSHSARDKYSLRKMKDMGLANTLFTGCVTMWGLNHDACEKVPEEKQDAAILTLTAHRAGKHDQILLDSVLNNYKKVYFWPQGDRDEAHFNTLQYDAEKVEILPRTLKAFEAILRKGGVDYVGTRLHGGIHALNHGVRTIVIEVDNRAAEIARDTGLPTVPASNIDELPEAIRSNFKTEITMPWDSIEKWKKQF